VRDGTGRDGVGWGEDGWGEGSEGGGVEWGESRLDGMSGVRGKLKVGSDQSTNHSQQFIHSHKEFGSKVSWVIAALTFY
jgi:hypothetical protein